MVGGTAKPALSSDSWAIADIKTTDMAVRAKFSGTGANIWVGVVARFIDQNNYYSLQSNTDNGTIMLVKMQGGTRTYLTIVAGWVDGAELRL